MKKILLIVNEKDFDFQIILGKELRDQGFYVDLLICDRWNLFSNIQEIKKEIDKHKFDDFSIRYFDEMYKKLESHIDSNEKPKVDWEYLKKFEEKYNDGYSLNQVLRSDFAIADDFHTCRLYPFPKNREMQYKYLELNLKLIEEIYNSRKYDLIFSIGTKTVVKPILYKISIKNNIPFITLEQSRINNRWLFYDNFCIGPDKKILAEMSRISMGKNECLKADKVISEYLNSGEGIYQDIKRIINLSKKRRGFLFIIKKIYWVTKHHYFLNLKNIRKIPSEKGRCCVPTLFGTLRHYYDNYKNLILYSRNPKLNRKILPKEKYIYFPLHLIPESNTATQSIELNELSAITNLSIKIPPHWLIVVKLNPAMAWVEAYTKKNQFFNDLLKLPNVYVVSPEIPSFQLIKNSEAVACLAGTALIEGSMQNKKGIYWGQPEFNIISNLIHFNDFDNKFFSMNNSSNIRTYVQAVLNLSFDFDMEIIETGHSKSSQNYNDNIKLVKNFTQEAILTIKNKLVEKCS